MSQLRILYDNSAPFHPYQQYKQDHLKAESDVSALSFVFALMTFVRNDFHFLKVVVLTSSPIPFYLLLPKFLEYLRFRVAH